MPTQKHTFENPHSSWIIIHSPSGFQSRGDDRDGRDKIVGEGII